MNESYDCMLTTVDNPFDPFNDFDSWFMFDTANGYNCCSRLARIAKISEDLSQIEMEKEKERAIDEIVLHDPANIYIKVTKQIAVA